MLLCVCVCVCTEKCLHTCIFYFCPLRMPGRNNTSRIMSTPSTRSWLLNIILHQKKPGLIGEMVDSRAWSEKVQDKSRIPYYAQKHKWQLKGWWWQVKIAWKPWKGCCLPNMEQIKFLNKCYLYIIINWISRKPWIYKAICKEINQKFDERWHI